MANPNGETLATNEAKKVIALGDDYYGLRVLNYARGILNSQRAQNICSQHVRDIKAHNLDNIKKADARSQARMGINNDGTTSPAAAAPVGGDDAMDLRLHSPQTIHNHYPAPAQAATPAPASKMSGLAKAGIGAALLATGLGAGLGAPLIASGIKQWLKPAAVAPPVTAPTSATPAQQQQKIPDIQYEFGLWPPQTTKGQ